MDVRSTQNSCVIVCANVLGWGQMEVSRGENISCFSWLSYILSIHTIFFRWDTVKLLIVTCHHVGAAECKCSLRTPTKRLFLGVHSRGLREPRLTEA